MDKNKISIRVDRAPAETISAFWASAIRVGALVLGVAVVLAALMSPP